MGALTELQKIPGVGASLSQDLVDLGYRTTEELKGKVPEEIYHDLMVLKGEQIDRCVLYVLRVAVYYASNSVYQPELLKWWKWKDDQQVIALLNNHASDHKHLIRQDTRPA